MVQEVEDSQGELQGKFALKCLAKGKPLKAYERFVREVDAIQSLRHSAIISIVDHSSRDADFHY